MGGEKPNRSFSSIRLVEENDENESVHLGPFAHFLQLIEDVGKLFEEIIFASGMAARRHVVPSYTCVWGECKCSFLEQGTGDAPGPPGAARVDLGQVLLPFLPQAGPLVGRGVDLGLRAKRNLVKDFPYPSELRVWVTLLRELAVRLVHQELGVLLLGGGLERHLILVQHRANLGYHPSFRLPGPLEGPPRRSRALGVGRLSIARPLSPGGLNSFAGAAFRYLSISACQPREIEQRLLVSLPRR